MKNNIDWGNANNVPTKYYDARLAYNPIQTPPYTNRKFFGIVTFGTPHGGAKIAA